MRTSSGVIHARQTVLRKSITEWKQWAFLAAFSFVLPAIPAEQSFTAPATNKVDVMDKSLEELMTITITSVSKRPEKLSDAPAAIYVITQEDIRRSGVTSIPEALRMAPGMEVARQDAHTWAISSRGFNDEFANQLLVLIDGRSVYTPLFASSDAAGLSVTLLTFYVLLAIWCFVGYAITHHPAVARVLARYGHIVVPFVLVGLGIYIIADAGTFKLLRF